MRQKDYLVGVEDDSTRARVIERLSPVELIESSTFEHFTFSGVAAAAVNGDSSSNAYASGRESVTSSNYIERKYLDNPENFELILGSCIGSGQQGRVYKAILRNLTTNEEYDCVAKELNDAHEFERHQSVTLKIRSSVVSGVLRIIGVKEHSDRLFAILPLCECMFSDVLKRLHSLDSSLKAVVIMDFLQSMQSALSELSKNPNTDERTVHRDPKSDNVALRSVTSTTEGECWGFALLDFGSAKTFREMNEFSSTISSTIGCTPAYMAPELTAEDPKYVHPQLVDMYSIGVMGWEALGVKINYVDKIREYTNVPEETRCANAVAVDAKQHELRVEIRKYTADFWGCLTYLFKAMCEVLPFNRPTLETFQFAITHLKSMMIPVDRQVLIAFYETVAAEVVLERAERSAQEQMHRQELSSGDGYSCPSGLTTHSHSRSGSTQSPQSGALPDNPVVTGPLVSRHSSALFVDATMNERTLAGTPDEQLGLEPT